MSSFRATSWTRSRTEKKIIFITQYMSKVWSKKSHNESYTKVDSDYNENIKAIITFLTTEVHSGCETCGHTEVHWCHSHQWRDLCILHSSPSFLEFISLKMYWPMNYLMLPCTSIVLPSRHPTSILHLMYSRRISYIK